MALDKNEKSSVQNLLKRSQKHTSRVKLLRRFLPIIGLLAILSVLLWSTFETFFEKKVEGIPAKAQNLMMHNKLLNPRLHSTDSSGNPYKIQAESATQSDDDKASFDKPFSETIAKNAQQIKLKSDKGFLNQETQEFTYDGNVRLETNDGYSFETKKAVVDLKSQNVEGKDPVVGRGPVGKITSEEGFMLDKKTQELHFKGPTKMTIHPRNIPKKGEK